MAAADSSFSQSRLDETGRSQSGLSSKPPRPSNTSGLDAAELDGNASIAFSDAASDRSGKPRPQRTPSGTSARSGAGGAGGSFAPSFSGGVRPDDDDAASLAPSDRGSRPRSSGQRTPSATSARGGPAGGAGGTSSRLASETNFAFGGAEDDDGASSVSASADRSSRAQDARSPSLASGRGRGGGPVLASQSSLGGASVDHDDDGSASVAPSKPKSSRAPSQRAPSTSGSNLGFSGFSTLGAGKEQADGDGDADGGSGGGSGSSGSRRTSAKGSAPPSQRPTSSSGGVSRKTSEVNPGTSAGGGGGAGGDSSFAADASIAFSDAASDLRAGSTAGAGKAPSVAPPGSTRSARISGASGTISYDKDEDTATPTRRRSFASSLRQSVASHKTASAAGSDDSDGGDGDGDGDGDDGEATAAGSLHNSNVSGGGRGDDAASMRSGVSAASGKSRSSAAPSGTSAGGGATSARSGRTASASSARSTAKSATEADEYGGDEFEEEVAEDDGSSAGEDAAASESVASGSRVSSAASSRRPGSATASSRRGNSATSGRSGYSNDFEAGSASGRQSGATPASAAVAEDEEAAAAAAAAAASGSIFRAGSAAGSGGAPPALNVSGSILQGGGGGSEGGTPGSRRVGSAVFRRLPADAPDDGASAVSGGAEGRPLHRSGSSLRSGSQADADGGGASEWNEGAIRVAAPGAPRPYNARAESAGAAGAYGGRQRPMSAAPRDRQSAMLDGLTRKHPGTWDSTDVANWVDFLGLGQYRRRFLHHCIDGRLLLRLTDQQLKSDLGIGPVGHRYAILDAARTLVRAYKDAQRDRLGSGSDAGGSGADDESYSGGGGGGRTSAAPRSRPRPASAMPGALTGLPPPPPSFGARRPASASRSVIPPDPYLGPAMGKVTVYEQRAKLLFELDRAQARAEQHRALAEQLKYTATLSSEEVNHIRGLLAEIEKKNRAAFELAGGVDSQARVPWRHVGNGTKHNNWNPERFARPGEPETVDLTFQPRCTNPESRKLLGLGGGDYGEHPSAVNSFLDRLNNDLRKREQARKELERRYYSDGSTNPGAQSEADFQLVADALQNRCHITMERDPETYGMQIDEALDKLATSESWREAGLNAGPIRSAHGPAKLQAFASAVRSLSFMERYRSDLRSKDGRIRALEKKWINQTLGSQYLPGGKDKDDLEEAAKFFALLGWRDGEGNASEEAVDAELLDRLLDRAIEYRKKYDNWWERVRDKPEERAAGFKCDINWTSHPWDSDGLGALMEAEMQRMGDETVKKGDGPADFVEFTVRLLGKCREDDLHRLHSLNPRPKRLGVYRAIRTQKFIEFTQKDLEERDRKLRQAYQALAPPRRKLESSRIEGFFERLVEDAAKRRAKAEKMAHDKVLKEQEILASSVMYGRPGRARSAR